MKENRQTTTTGHVCVKEHKMNYLLDKITQFTVTPLWPRTKRHQQLVLQRRWPTHFALGARVAAGRLQCGRKRRRGGDRRGPVGTREEFRLAEVTLKGGE